MAEQILLLRIIKTFVGIIGLFGNGLVCLVIYRVPALHTMTNAFIVNQAVADLMGSVFLLLLSNIDYPAILPEGTAGVLLCRLWISDFFLWACFITSTFNLVGLTFERYVAIVFPFRYPTFYTKRNSCFMLAAAWFLGTMFATYSIAIRAYEGRQCAEKLLPYLKDVGFVITIIQYFVPTFTMLFAYIHIIVVLHRSANRVGVATASTATSDGREASLLRARRNTFKTLLIVYIIYFCCWTPNLTVFAMFNLGWPLDFKGALYIISVALAASNSCVNPIIYALKYRQFQNGLKRLWMSIRGREHVENVSWMVEQSADRLTYAQAQHNHDG
ncbi:galanin receptor 2b-like [Patiria miniata]|uniref:G-protein coupled receptors family 1 profile domain-containing protein n=1 Tax=Patiria miniata TaxID=46514 RepID=A0A914AB72_PATMI|nr:galanin receptor 2b-like [Patiria miniata]